MQLVPRENFDFLIVGITFSFFVFGLLIWSFRSISWKEILLVSCLMRLSLIDVPVQWSDDIYRFFWDGMKVRHLESPYQMPPSEDERRSEWDEFSARYGVQSATQRAHARRAKTASTSIDALDPSLKQRPLFEPPKPE